MFLKQATAAQSRLVGPFVDDTDFKTVETGLTIANTDVKLSINGAAGANKNSGGGTHRNNGMYGLTFDATDTATVGELTGSVVVSGALPVAFKFFVLEEEVYDDLMAAAAVGYLKPTTAGRDLDVSAGGEAGLDWANIGGPTTAQNLSGTNIDVDQVVASVSGAVGSVTGAVGSVTGLTPATVHSDLDDIQLRLPTALVSGRMDVSVGAMAANVLTASALAADAVDEILDEQIGDGTITMRQALRVLIAGMAAKLSGAATTTVTIRNLADSANVIVATVDSDGNRSAVVVTP